MSKKTLVISILLVTVIGVLAASSNGSIPMLNFLSNTPKTDTTMTQEVVTEMVGQWEKNGNTYTTTLEYETPAGTDTNELSITVTDGSLTAFTMDTTQTTNGASRKYQTQFIEAFESEYIGTPISELKTVDVIGGASGTTKAFTAALQQL